MTEFSSNGVYENGKLIRQTLNGVVTDYLYGQEGLLGFVTNGETYLYEKNIFGDIVKIYNSVGEVVGEYSYTAFGECNVITSINNIAYNNPFRYRGYYMESYTGLYYLKTRFYNPKTGRFISPDDTKYLQPDVINGLNLYAYCNNNPVMNIDPNGKTAVKTLSYEYSIGISSLFSYKYNLWSSRRYDTSIQRYGMFDRSIKAEWKNFIKNCYVSIINFNFDFISHTTNSFNFINVGLSGLDIKYKLNTIDLGDLNVGLSLLGGQVGIGVGEEGFNVNAKAIAGELYLENDYGSVGVNLGIGGEIGWKNGTLSLGLSLGWGVSIKINFRKIFN